MFLINKKLQILTFFLPQCSHELLKFPPVLILLPQFCVTIGLVFLLVLIYINLRFLLNHFY